jgi:hypothetical protein
MTLAEQVNRQIALRYAMTGRLATETRRFSGSLEDVMPKRGCLGASAIEFIDALAREAREGRAIR